MVSVAGLREKSKARRRDAILRASGELFAEQGYAATRMEAIAERAEVALSTLYQYFPSKTDLAREIYVQDVDLVRGLQEGVIADPPDDPVEAVMALISTDASNSTDYADLETWRQIVVAGLTATNSDGMGVDPFSESELVPFRRLLERLRQQGGLPQNTEIEPLASVLAVLNFSVFFHRIVSRSDRAAALERARRDVVMIVGAVTANTGSS